MAEAPRTGEGRAIGVFDSGLGGLTVLKALRARLPGERFVYLGDTANAPYGSRPNSEIFDLTVAGVERLFAEGCPLIVLACNTASAVALRRMQEGWLPGRAPEARVLGVFVPVIEALTGRPWGYHGPPRPARVARVGFFATPATVASGAFTRELSFRATELEVAEIGCHGLVAAIEAGERARAERLVAEHSERLLDAMPEVEAVVLGCTHFPLMQSAFRAALPAGVEILSQPAIVAESLADYLARHPRFTTGGTGALRALTTGNPVAVSDGAANFTGEAIVFDAA